jgi:hypothetical protein
MSENIQVKVNDVYVEFYAKPEQGAFYEVGKYGDIGEFYIPMDADGSPSTYDGEPDVITIEVKWQDA